MASRTSKWLRVDEREDAINSLEHAAETALTLNSNPLNWKWVIISLHSALQGVLVCALSGTAGVGALTDISKEKMLEWFEKTRTNPKTPKPRERLADPITLFERAMIPDFMSEFGGSPLRSSQEQYDDVKLLNNLRRNFAHFRPMGWSIETEGLPRLVLNVTSIIEVLMLSHPANTYRMKKVQTTRARRAIRSLRKQIGGTRTGTKAS